MTTATTSPPGERVGDRKKTIRVASAPASHVYVRHLDPVDGTSAAVRRLPDPDPDDPSRAAGAKWWPPVVLDPAWVEQNHAAFDIFHVHFGFDACSVQHLEALVDALRRRGKPLVYTVHDLRNPHHSDPADHDRHLDVLVPGADALITLTPGAADVIRERWGRSATVLGHPHVVDLPTMTKLGGHRRRDPRTFRVGVHLKSLRPSMEPMPVLEVLRDELESLPGAILQVNGHRNILLPDGDRYDAAVAGPLLAWSRAGEIDLRIHDFFPDDELWRYLHALDASVLPYRFGTHSGWLEACRDLGTPVLAPTCGFYADQGPVLSYHHDEDGLDAESLAGAIRTAYDDRPSFAMSPGERRTQRQELSEAHDELYRALLR